MTNTESFSSDTDAQLVAGSLYGLRAFAFHYDYRTTSLVLRSPCNGGPNWQAGEMQASCTWASIAKMTHVVGNAQCSCGFYSYWRRGPAKTYYPASSQRHTLNGIMGVIEAYGRVTVGDKGMRSEKARIVGLVVPQTITGKLRDPSVAEILEQFPDVRTFRTLTGAAMAFGIGGRPKITK